MISLPNFDDLSELAKTSPTDFEALRSQLLHEMIEKANPNTQRRLKGLQFQVEMERKRAATPQAACTKINAMMLESLSELTQLLREESQQSYCETGLEQAKVISMNERRTR